MKRASSSAASQGVDDPRMASRLRSAEPRRGTIRGIRSTPSGATSRTCASWKAGASPPDRERACDFCGQTDGADEIVLFLDRDTNPYNGNNARTLRHFTMPRSENATSARVSVPTDGIVAGDYYIGLVIIDSKGILRVSYTGQIEVTAGASSKPPKPAKVSARFSTMPIAPAPFGLSAVQPPRQRVIDLLASL